MDKGHGAVQHSVTAILRPSDHLFIFFPSEGNIASEDSSLSDALVLEDGMLTACMFWRAGRKQGGMCELLIDTQNAGTALCNNPLKHLCTKKTLVSLDSTF